jgi:hypothetical protein
MNNIGELINNSISILQKGFLLIIGFFSFLNPDTSSINTANIEGGKLISPVNSLFVFSTPNIVFSKNTPEERANEIISTLNISTDNLSLVPTDKDQLVKSIDKLSKLDIKAPNYSTLKTGGYRNEDAVKNTPTETKPEAKVIKSLDSSVVNIRCESKTSKTLKVITGSGVIISSSGLILTAAHVAAPIYGQQNTNKYDCFARINNPATGNYSLRVVFIDPNWVSKYYSVFDKNHTETGEHDIAILQMDISNLSSVRPAEISRASINNNDSISIQSYPSDVYGKLGVFTVLPRKSESNSIGGLLNFDGSSYSPYSLIETKPSSLGQSGASGGGIFNNQGHLIGIISNSVPSEILLKNKIRGLTIDYIDERIKANLGRSIFEYNQ